MTSRSSAALGVAALAMSVPLLVGAASRASASGTLVPTHARTAAVAAAKPFAVTQQGSTPWLVVSGNGTGHVVWNEAKKSPQSDVTHYCQLARGQTACSHAQSFSVTGAEYYDFAGPKIVRTDQDDLVLLTSRCCTGQVGTYGFVSTNGGTSFGPQKLLGTNPPQVASGDAEFGPGAFSVTTVTETETAGTFAQSLQFQGGSVASGRARLNSDVSAFAIYDGSVAMIDATTPIAAFSDHSTIFYRRWSGSGDINATSSWLPTQTFGAGSYPHLASGPKGVFMLYTTGDTGQGNYAVARYDPQTGGFSKPTTLDTHANAFIHRQDLWEDTSGNLHAVWRREDAGGDHLMYALSRDGRTWSTPQALATASLAVGMNDLHVRTAHDGGGYAIWNAGDGTVWAVALAPLGGSGGTASCPTELRFGVTVALAKQGCFKREGSAYSISEPIRINGLDVDAPAGLRAASSTGAAAAMPKITIEPSLGSLTTAGAVLVGAGPVKLGRQALDWRIPSGGGDVHDAAGNPATLHTDDLHTKLLGLPVSGYVTPRFRKGAADLPVNLLLPSPVSGAIGGAESSNITLHTDQASSGGLQIDKGNFHLHVDDAFLGIAELKPIDINYTADPEVLSGHVGIYLPVVSAKLDSTFLFQQGAFVDATAALDFPSPGLPVATSVFLNEINFHAHKLTSCTAPTSIGGGVVLSGGPSIAGVALVRITGDVTYAFPESSCGLPGVLTAKGTGYVFDLPVADVEATYKTSGFFGFGAHVDVGSPKTVDVRAGIDGAVDFRSGQFFAGGDADVTALGYSLVHAHVLLSNIGIGACVTLVPLVPGLASVDGGFEYKWGDHLSLMFPSCDVSDLKPAFTATRWLAGSFREAATFTVPRGVPSFGVAAFGAAAPRVTVTDPQGHAFTTPGPGALTDSAATYKTAQLPGLGETAVTLVKPVPGRWTLTAAAGSVVDRVLTGAGHPKPSVRAHVTHAGGRSELLAYHVRQIAGQTVRFVEQGPDTSRVIGVARAASGKIGFRAGDGRGGARTIVALVSQDGLPRARLTVARYTAPPPMRPSRPRVRARRAGARIALTWTASDGAGRYVVRALMRDGRRTQWLLPVSRRSLLIPRVPGIDSARLLVAGLARDGVVGRSGTAGVAPHPKRKPKPKPKPKHGHSRRRRT